MSDLETWLRTHAPVAPVAPAWLEDRIVALATDRVRALPHRQNVRRGLVLCAAAAAVAALVSFAVVKNAQSTGSEPVPTPVERFVEASWDATFADGPDSEYTYLSAGLGED